VSSGTPAAYVTATQLAESASRTAAAVRNFAANSIYGSCVLLAQWIGTVAMESLSAVERLLLKDPVNQCSTLIKIFHADRYHAD
jgi:hypothetical protein